MGSDHRGQGRHHQPTTQRTIDLDAFIRLLDGQVDEGDNGILYLDKSGIRSSIAPDVSERQAVSLFSDEKAALREHERDCLLAFPCTIDEALAWIERMNVSAPRDSRGRPRKIPIEALDRYNTLIDQGARPLIARLITEVIFDADYHPGSLRIASQRWREKRGRQ